MSTLNSGFGGDNIAAVRFSEATPPVIAARRNITSVVRNGKGDWTVTISEACDVQNRVAIAGAGGAVANIVTADESVGTDTTVHVLAVDNAGAAIDSVVSLVVNRTTVGTTP